MLLGEILEALSTTPTTPGQALSRALEQIRGELDADQAVLVLHPDGPERPAGYVAYGSQDSTALRAAQLSTVTSFSFVREMLKSENPRLKTVQMRDPTSASANALHIRHLIGVPVLDLLQPVNTRHCCGFLIADRRHPHAPFDESALQKIGSYAAELGTLLKALTDLRYALAPEDQRRVDELRNWLIEHKGKLSVASQLVGVSEHRARKLLADARLTQWHEELRERWQLSVDAFDAQLSQTRDLPSVAAHFDRDYHQIDDFFRHKLSRTLKEHVIGLGYNWKAIRGPELVRLQRRPAAN